MDKVFKSLSLLNWIFFRLPLAFSLSFTALTVWWIFNGFRWASELAAARLLHIATLALKTVLPAVIAEPLVKNLNAFLLALIIVLLFF